MADPRKPSAGLLARPNDDRIKTFAVAILTGVTCALVISVSAVLLRPYQQANIAQAQAARVEAMLDRLPGLRAVMLESGATGLTTYLVDLDTGEVLPEADPGGWSFEAAIQDETASIGLSEAEDPAGLRRRPNIAPVHLLERDGRPVLVVLPVRGVGYASTMSALLALEADLVTIAALTVLEQAETPGLGARITEPAWQAQWAGKRIADDSGALRISVVRTGADGPFEVDAISGATRTSNGIETMLRFWLGPLGYGPYLDRLRQGGI